MDHAVVQRWLRQVLAPYQNADHVYADVDRALIAVSSLSPKTEVFTFNDGRTQLLLTLTGTIPIQFRSNTYNIPVAFWIPRDYPREPPFAFVVPTPDMLVRKGPNVDPNGEIGGTYIQRWRAKPEACNLLDFIQNCQHMFGLEPPVYAKPRTPASPSPSPAASPGFHHLQQQQNHPDPRQRPPPPAPAPAPAPAPTPGRGQGPGSRSGSLSDPSTPSTSTQPHPPSRPPKPVSRPGSVDYHPALGYSYTNGYTTAGPSAAHAPAPAPVPPPLGHGSSRSVSGHYAYAAQPHAHSHLQSQPQPSPPPPPPPPPPRSASGDYGPQQAAYANANGGPARAQQGDPARLSSLLDELIVDDAPPRPPNPQLVALHDELHAKLSARLAALSSSLDQTNEQLAVLSSDLDRGRPAIEDEMRRLEAVRDVCRVTGDRLDETTRAARDRIDWLRSREDLDPDGLIVATSIVGNQYVPAPDPRPRLGRSLGATELTVHLAWPWLTQTGRPGRGRQCDRRRTVPARAGTERRADRPGPVSQADTHACARAVYEARAGA